MNDFETRLSAAMHQKAGELTTPPPPPIPGSGSRIVDPPRRGGRLAAVLIAAAVAVVGAGVTFPVLGNRPSPGPQASATPATDRFIIASGEADNGHWDLLVYRDLYGQTVVPEWCMVLDQAAVEEDGKLCTRWKDPSQPDPLGGGWLIPSFRGDEGFIYGSVSSLVARVEIHVGNEGVVSPPVIPAPEELGLAGGYFFAFVPSEKDLVMVALDGAGNVLKRRSIPTREHVMRDRADPTQATARD